MFISQLLSLFSQKSLRSAWRGLSGVAKRGGRRQRGFRHEIQSAETRVLLSSALVSGQSLSTSISAGGEQDLYTFKAGKGNAVTINLARTTINYAPVVDIFSPTGRQIYDGQAAGSPSFDILLNTFSESGEYTVIVKADTLAGVGNYNLTYIEVGVAQTLPLDEGLLTSGVTRQIGRAHV